MEIKLNAKELNIQMLGRLREIKDWQFEDKVKSIINPIIDETIERIAREESDDIEEIRSMVKDELINETD